MGSGSAAGHGNCAFLTYGLFGFATAGRTGLNGRLNFLHCRPCSYGKASRVASVRQDQKLRKLLAAASASLSHL